MRLYTLMRWYAITVVAVAALGSIIFLVFPSLGAGGMASPTHERYAARILETCADEAYRPACYDREIPTLMDRGLTMEDAFSVTRIVQQRDEEYAYCHVLGHYLSAKETAKDPQKWKDVIARAPQGVCSNGAIHGAFQERFRKEHLDAEEIAGFAEEIVGVCEPRAGWQPTRLEQGSCVHALGHLTMYVTKADIHAALSLCDAALPRKDQSFRQLCYDGAFMQIFQPLEPDDFALIVGKEIETKEAARAFCADARFSAAAQTSCIGESWPLYRAELEDPAQVGVVCGALAASSTQAARCYNGIFYVLTSLSGLATERMTSYCAHVERGLADQCFANAASRMIEVDWGNIGKATAICAAADVHGAGDACYDELLRYSTYNYHAGTEPFFALCAALPGAWGSRCYNQQSIWQ